MAGRTVREFTYKENIWPVVEQWAADSGFSSKKQEMSRRIYRKGHILLMAPAFLEIRQEGKRVILEAWVSADTFLILNLLTGKKPEMQIESGGLTASIPRKRAREAINLLLQRLGQELIG